MNRSWRLINAGKNDPYTNMAVDEAILRSYRYGKVGPTLRIYGWKPAGLSIGCAQNPYNDLDIKSCLENSMPYVRRMTGGGIILHDDEITYSLVCRKSDLDISEAIPSSYRIICSFLLRFYRRLGLDANFACQAMTVERLGSHSALCSAAKEKYDIVISGRKIGGNAQRRMGDIIFQHGSIPISHPLPAVSDFLKNKSLAKMGEEALFLKGLLDSELGLEQITHLLAESFQEAHEVNLNESTLSFEEQALAEDLREHKYSTNLWNVHHIDPTRIVIASSSDSESEAIQKRGCFVGLSASSQ